jgi:hypothetical protein
MSMRLPLVLLLLLLLAACAILNPPQKQRRAALDDFIYALRWQQHQAAAAFFVDAQREAFLEQMDALQDLNITDVRLQRLDFKDEGRRAEARLEMDYHILPSVTIKTLRIDQTWSWFDAGTDGQYGFLITTPFPKLP